MILVMPIYLHHKCCWCNTSLDWTFQFQRMWSLLLCKELDHNNSFNTYYYSHWLKILIHLHMEKNENNERWCHCPNSSHLYRGYFSMVMFCQVLLSRHTKYYAGISLTLLGLGLIKINDVSANFNNPRPSLILNN